MQELKNIGPAGLTIVIISKELMEKGDSSLPKILCYSEHSKANSMLNTPPTSLGTLLAKYLNGSKDQEDWITLKL